MSSEITGATVPDTAPGGARLPSVVPRAHLLAAAQAAVVARIDALPISAVGPDAPAFLHGQLANDVTGLPVGGVNLSLHLNHKGHAVAEGSVLRRGKSDLLYVVEGAAAEWVFDSLSGHIIFDDVALGRPELVLITVQGAGASALLPEAPAAGQALTLELRGHAVTVYGRRRSEHGGFDLLVALSDVDGVVKALTSAGATPVGRETLDALRVAAGLPSAAGEGGEGVLPQEAGLEHALSYRKGCYLGQEIMARIEARGNLRRSLTRLGLSAVPGSAVERADGAGGAPTPAPSAARTVYLEGRAVGALGTVVIREADEAGGRPTVEALAVLRNDVPPAARFTVAGVEAWVQEG